MDEHHEAEGGPGRHSQAPKPASGRQGTERSRTRLPVPDPHWGHAEAAWRGQASRHCPRAGATLLALCRGDGRPRTPPPHKATTQATARAAEAEQSRSAPQPAGAPATPVGGARQSREVTELREAPRRGTPRDPLCFSPATRGSSHLPSPLGPRRAGGGASTGPDARATSCKPQRRRRLRGRLPPQGNPPPRARPLRPPRLQIPPVLHNKHVCRSLGEGTEAQRGSHMAHKRGA